MGQKPSILVVDDHSNWRDLIQSLLASDYDVALAVDYSQGLQAYRDKFPPYCVVITDMRLDEADTANVDGLRLIEEIKKQGSYTQTIVITGYPSVETVKRALVGYEAYEYFEKSPSSGRFDLEGFRAAVRGAVAKAEAARHMWEQVHVRKAWISHCRKAFGILPEVEPDVDERLCFVIMPFSEDFDLVYDCISGAVADCPDCECKRADDVDQPGVLTNQIWVSMNKANLIIADLTNRNPNVFYELGLCHALGKRVILLTQHPTDVPRQLGGLVSIRYARTSHGLLRLRNKLAVSIQNALGTAVEDWNLFSNRDYSPDDIQYKSCVVLFSDVIALGSSTTSEREAAESSREFYDELITEVLDGEGLTAVEMGSIFGPRLTIEAIWGQINTAPLVIADMSSRAPEVFYAVGLAHVLCKPVILLTSKPDSIPSDLRHIRYIRYTPDLSRPETGIEFAEKLRAAIRDTFELHANMTRAMSVDTTTTTGSKATGRVTIFLEVDVQEFTPVGQESFILTLSRTVRISPDQIRILRVAPGSIVVTLEMPEEAAQLLASMYLNRDPVLQTLRIVKVDLRPIAIPPDIPREEGGQPSHSESKGTETFREIEELVRQDRLDEALERLANVEEHQRDAALLARRLNSIHRQQRQGRITREQGETEYTEIANDILSLLPS